MRLSFYDWTEGVMQFVLEAIVSALRFHYLYKT